MFTISQVRSAISIVALLGLASTASADVMTNSPGSACIAAGSGTINIRSDGEIENPSGSTVTVVCPVDRPISPSVATTVSGRAFVINQGATSKVCCKVISKNPDGDIVPGDQICSSTASPTYQSLLLPAITDSTTFSHFAVVCTLPPANGLLRSRLQVYRATTD